MLVQKEDQRQRTMQYLNAELNPLRTCAPHPGVIRLHGVCDQGQHTHKNTKVEQVIYVVQELAPNGELFDYVSYSSFDDKTIRCIARQLFSAVKHMKEGGFTHRDLKPENVVVDANFTLKIIDWGFAKAYQQG